MSLYDALRATWMAGGIPVNPGATAAQVETFEAAHGLALPPDFREYLLTVNGMQSGSADENLMSFFPLEEIDAEIRQPVSRQQLGDPRSLLTLPFADFLISSHVYLMNIYEPSPGSVPVVAWAGDDFQKQVAPSFESFVARYLDDPCAVAYCF